MTDNVFQSAYDQLRQINTRDRRRIMQEELDSAESRKVALSIEMGNQRSDLVNLRALRDELDRAVVVKETLLNETLATYESVNQVAANLDMQIKRMAQ